mgnify:CR=1 FL=1
MGGRQIAILGKHPSEGSYLWPDGFGPERLAPPPDDWWQLIVEFSKKFDRKRPISSAITSSGDWVRISYCKSAIEMRELSVASTKMEIQFAAFMVELLALQQD